MKRIEFQDIPNEIKGKYRLKQEKDHVSVHKPAYVNIDKPVIVKEDKFVYEFENDKVSVEVWKNIVFEHITVY